MSPAPAILGWRLESTIGGSVRSRVRKSWEIDMEPPRWINVWGSDFIDGPTFTSAAEVEAFVVELREAAKATFDDEEKR